MSSSRKVHPPIGRRPVLRGLFGATVGLPLLDVFAPRSAGAAAPDVPNAPTFSFFFVGCNGVMQSWLFGGGDAEKTETFWPTSGDLPKGQAPFRTPLSRAALEADRPQRTTGEFAEYADRLLLVKGVDHPFPAVGCTHHSGNQQVLTAAKTSAGKGFENQLAQGESIDTRIAREKNPAGREPLSLHVGENKAGGVGFGYPSYVSFRGPLSPRAAEPNPINAYTRMVGLAGAGPEVAARIARARTSVNDLVRGQLSRLLARTDLSAADRKRLDQHTSSIRDLEVKMASTLPQTAVAAMKAVDGKQHENANHDDVVRLQLDLVAFAFASDYTRTAVLKTGDINDRTRYTIDGVQQPVFHMISHRVLSDGGSGPPIMNAVALHAKIDRIYAGHFKHFLDRARDLDTPHGKLIDLGYFAWTNQIGTGWAHGFRDIPWVIVGDARGYLKTGQFVNLSNVYSEAKDRVTSNKLLSTLVNAAGIRKADGAPVDDFGDPGLPKGIVPEIVR
jgi:hypothetical protein